MHLQFRITLLYSYSCDYISYVWHLLNGYKCYIWHLLYDYIQLWLISVLIYTVMIDACIDMYSYDWYLYWYIQLWLIPVLIYTVMIDTCIDIYSYDWYLYWYIQIWLIHVLIYTVMIDTSIDIHTYVVVWLYIVWLYCLTHLSKFNICCNGHIQLWLALVVMDI